MWEWYQRDMKQKKLSVYTVCELLLAYGWQTDGRRHVSIDKRDMSFLHNTVYGDEKHTHPPWLWFYLDVSIHMFKETHQKKKDLLLFMLFFYEGTKRFQTIPIRTEMTPDMADWTFSFLDLNPGIIQLERKGSLISKANHIQKVWMEEDKKSEHKKPLAVNNMRDEQQQWYSCAFNGRRNGRGVNVRETGQINFSAEVERSSGW